MSEEYSDYIEINDCDFANFTSQSSGALVKLTSGSKLFLKNSEKGKKGIRNCTVTEKGIIEVLNSTFAS